MMKQVPVGCRHMGRLRKHGSYSSKNINVIQRWGLLVVGSLCFPWLDLLSSWGAPSRRVVVTGGSQGHLSGRPVWSIQWASLRGQSTGCSGGWVKRSGGVPERLCGFGCWARLSQLFSPSFLVSYSKARKEACGLRQRQAPLRSPANCKEEGWNQNRKGKASRRMCSHPFILGGLRLPTEQVLSAPVPLHWVCYHRII